MAAIQFTRFETVFPNRESLIGSLNLKSRCTAEAVCGSYLDTIGQIEVILVIFKSSNLGDYEIIFDSASESIYHKIRKISRPDISTTDLECIELILEGKMPIQFDLVIINNVDTSKTIYQYSDGVWYLLYKNPDIETLMNTISTETAKIELNPSIIQGGVKTLSVDVKIDNESLIYDNQLDKIRVNKINGGNF